MDYVSLMQFSESKKYKTINLPESDYERLRKLCAKTRRKLATEVAVRIEQACEAEGVIEERTPTAC